jgi:hypothetical protein
MMRDHRGGETLPAPECRLGYTAVQTAAMMRDDLPEYRAWAYGKTQGVCSGSADDYQQCAIAHGVVDYASDVGRYLRHR